MPNPSNEMITKNGALCIVYHHRMPKRFDQDMSAAHLRRKLRRHSGGDNCRLPVHGVIGVHKGPLWTIAEEDGITVARVRDFLLEHKGEYITRLDLFITVDLDARAREVAAHNAALEAGQ